MSCKSFSSRYGRTFSFLLHFEENQSERNKNIFSFLPMRPLHTAMLSKNIGFDSVYKFQRDLIDDGERQR